MHLFYPNLSPPTAPKNPEFGNKYPGNKKHLLGAAATFLLWHTEDRIAEFCY
jgi:hypothetical protein